MSQTFNVATDTTASATQADGKEILVGTVAIDNGTEGAIIRIDADGSVDSSFNGGLTVALNDPGYYNFHATSVATDAAGEIVVAGYVTGRQSRAYGAVVRLNSAGSVDPTFGTGGWMTRPFGNDGELNALAIDSNRRIVLGGSDFSSDRKRLNSFAFARLNADGLIDSTFGRRGYAVVSFPRSRAREGIYRSTVTALALAGNGTIVAVGGDQFAEIARLKSDGFPDASFGANGRAVPSNSSGPFNAVTITGDGEIYAARGMAIINVFDNPSPFVVAKLTARGRPDVGFGQSGVIIQAAAVGGHRHVQSDPGGIALTANGDVLVSGAVRRSEVDGVFLAKFNSIGSFDTTFGAGGVSVVPTLDVDFHNAPTAHGVSVRADGFLVPYFGGAPSAGATETTAANRPALRAARFDATGAVVGSFASPGPFASGSNIIDSISTATDGAIYTSGRMADTGSFITKYNANGSANGLFHAAIGGLNRMSLGDVAASSDGVAVISHPLTTITATLEKLNADGSVETMFGESGSVSLPGGGLLGDAKLSLLSDGSFLTESFFGNDVPSQNSTVSVIDPAGQVAHRFATGFGPGTTGDAFLEVVVPAPGGKVVGVLEGFSNGGERTVRLVRYNADLTLDSSFESDTPLLLNDVQSLVVAPTGDVYIALLVSNRVSVTLVRILPDGTLDSSFGAGGSQMIDSKVVKLVVQADGRLLMVTSSGPNLQVTREDPDGVPDATFGSAGSSIINLGATVELSDVALQTLNGRQELLVSGALHFCAALPNGYVGRSDGFVARIDL